MGPRPAALGLPGLAERQRDEAGELQARGRTRSRDAGSSSSAPRATPSRSIRTWRSGPVLDLDLLVSAADLDGLAGFLGKSEFKPVASHRAHPRRLRWPDADHPPRWTPRARASRTRTARSSTAPSRSAPSAVLLPPRRPRTRCSPSILEQAHAGYSVPTITFVDLRELLLGAPSMQGAYSHPLDLAAGPDAGRSAGGSQRAVYASTRIVAALFPETAGHRRLPGAGPAPGDAAHFSTALVVAPLAQLGRMRETRGAERLRRLLTGGRSPSSS